MATTTFNDLITFSRGSNATVTGSNGLIQWAPNNLLTFSEQFDNAAWTKNNGTVAANTTAAPDGTLTADKFVENTSNSSHFIIQSATTTATIHTFSVYAKAAGRTFVLLYHDQSNSGAVFNLSNGTITTPSGIPLATASVTDAGNGWYRCAITVTATAASNGFRAQLGDTATNYVYTGDGVSGILLWGAQLELGSTATTYNNTSVRNLLGFSEAFDNAAWVKTRASIVTGAQANPVNGLFNAQKLMEDTDTANDHRIQSGSLTLVVGAPYTASVYLKAAGRNFARLYALHVASTSFTVDLTTGAITFQSNSGGVTANAISVGSGWWRVSYTFTVTNASTSSLYLALASNSSGTVTGFGDGNSGVYIYGAQLSNSASLDPYVPTPGAAPSSTAYYGPRFDYDPVTLAARGLLVEEARTNLLLNSLISGANLTTQNVTVTAVAHTISFYGTGTITLSGTHSATVNGGGAYPTRTTLTFTPTAGTLTCTVSGTVQFAQLEAGAFATSYIPTIASTVTRSADVATINGSLFSQWYSQPQGTFVVSGSFPQSNNAETLCVDDGSGANTLEIYRSSATKLNGFVRSGNVTVADMACSQTLSSGATYNTAIAYATDSFAFGIDGVAPTIDTAGAVPVAVNIMRIGLYRGNIQQVNGHIRNIRFIPARAADFQLQALST